MMVIVLSSAVNTASCWPSASGAIARSTIARTPDGMLSSVGRGGGCFSAASRCLSSWLQPIGCEYDRSRRATLSPIDCSARNMACEKMTRERGSVAGISGSSIIEPVASSVSSCASSCARSTRANLAACVTSSPAVTPQLPLLPSSSCSA